MIKLGEIIDYDGKTCIVMKTHEESLTIREINKNNSMPKSFSVPPNEVGIAYIHKLSETELRTAVILLQQIINEQLERNDL